VGGPWTSKAAAAAAPKTARGWSLFSRRSKAAGRVRLRRIGDFLKIIT
jgi:hypothetical protein